MTDPYDNQPLAAADAVAWKEPEEHLVKPIDDHLQQLRDERIKQLNAQLRELARR